MTRIGGDKVSLTIGNWAGIVVTLVGAMAAQWFLLQGRVTTLEVNYVNMQRQLGDQDSRSTAARAEILTAIKDLRAEMRSK